MNAAQSVGAAQQGSVSSGVADRVRSRLLEQGREASAANVVRALRSEGIVLDEESLVDLVGAVQRELLGAGPLETLFAESGVTDILVMGNGHVFIDRGQGIESHGQMFSDEAHVMRIATRLAGWAGRRLDEASPFVDARLPNGIRMHCVMSPIATDGTCISLRIPRSEVLTIEELVDSGSLDSSGADVLTGLVRDRRSFLITGGTGSGKTTVLGALLTLVSQTERIIIVEDTAELHPDHPHVVRMQSRPPNIEGAGHISMRDLVRQALRMRPDRIVVGEVRGAEVVDLLTALNTGHEGGCGTVHANSPADVPTRIQALGLMAGVPRDAIAALLISAVDAVVHVHRDSSGNRIVGSVHELHESRRGCHLTPVYERESSVRRLAC
jgi:pilus assembly protein CpaF